MHYLFICPKCKRKENIEMRMIDYTDLGHYCNNCGAEMQRDISSFTAHSIDKTGTFYRKFN